MKKFVNWLRFDKIMAMSLWPPCSLLLHGMNILCHPLRDLYSSIFLQQYSSVSFIYVFDVS